MYQYSDETLSDEFEVDLTGELHFTIGEIIARRGRHSAINSITIEELIDKVHRPTMWIELVYASVKIGSVKHIVYKYGGDQSDEMDFDARGNLKFARWTILFQDVE